MNDLDLVRGFYERLPEVTESRVAVGRERLLASIAQSSRFPGAQRCLARRRLVPRLVLTGAAVAAIAAAGVALHKRSPSAPTTAPPQRLSLAAQVLRAAALTDASQPTRRPSPEQWIYSKSVEFNIAQPVQEGEEWIRFDGSQDAYLQDGQIVVHNDPTAISDSGTALERYLDEMTPMNAYDTLMSLPSTPRALLRRVDVAVAAHPSSVASPGSSPGTGRTRHQLEFEFLTQLLWNASQAAPEKAEAAVFHAIATIPGVSAQRGLTDAVGRPAIGLSDSGDTQQLLLDPKTYQVTGLRTVSDGHWPVNPTLKRSPTYPSGTVIDSLAWQTIDFVAAPGRR